MAEAGKRNSTRQKKPPKYFHIEGEDYGNYGVVKAAESKEVRSTAQEKDQIAKTLVKFLISANQKYRTLHQDIPPEKARNTSWKKDADDTRIQHAQKGIDGKTLNSAADASYQAGKKSKDNHGRINQHSYEASKIAQRNGDQSKAKIPNQSKGQSNANIMSDMRYHAQLNDYIKQNYPDGNLSPEMLAKLAIPRGPMEAQTQPKPKPEKKKAVIHQVPQKEIKEDLKPFKRQAYHVAIAYHIHLRSLKKGGSEAGNIDPTYYARKLREQAASQPETRKKAEKNNTQPAQMPKKQENGHIQNNEDSINKERESESKRED